MTSKANDSYGHHLEIQRQRREWEEQRKAEKEAERLSKAREDLDREKNHRRESWMENGGDPADFDRAWPQMLQDIMGERYKARAYEDTVSGRIENL